MLFTRLTWYYLPYNCYMERRNWIITALKLVTWTWLVYTWCKTCSYIESTPFCWCFRC